MGPPETEVLAHTLSQFDHLVTDRLPRSSTRLPDSVEAALLQHVALGVRAIQHAHDALDGAEWRYHLVRALAAWRAALALLQEWTVSE
jgi:hypothetical protein